MNDPTLAALVVMMLLGWAAVVTELAFATVHSRLWVRRVTWALLVVGFLLIAVAAPYIVYDGPK